MMTAAQTVRQTEIAVVGCGPAGLMAALALASTGLPVTLIGRTGPSDNRTTALLGGSVAALDTLGVWDGCRAQAAALATMRIVDDTGRLWRAPEARFEAAEIGLEAFGYNIENKHLIAAMLARAGQSPTLTRIAQDVVAVTPEADRVTLRLADDTAVSSRLVVAADGRRSLCRAAAGIVMDERRYPQSALTVSFAHSRPHHDISTEFHTASGPFTLVPLPGLRSSLVWVLAPHEAQRLRALDDAELALAIEQRAHAILGKITLDGSRGLFPLSAATARQFATSRIALVGEAGHVIPPIGAQGLNLGLRDAAAIAEIAAGAARRGEDPGGGGALARYHEARRRDVTSRTLAVDLLNRSLLSDVLPLQGARGLGLYLIDRVGPLRRAVMREGVSPHAAQPRLMRGEAI